MVVEKKKIERHVSLTVEIFSAKYKPQSVYVIAKSWHKSVGTLSINFLYSWNIYYQIALVTPCQIIDTTCILIDMERIQIFSSNLKTINVSKKQITQKLLECIWVQFQMVKCLAFMSKCPNVSIFHTADRKRGYGWKGPTFKELEFFKMLGLNPWQTSQDEPYFHLCILKGELGVCFSDNTMRQSNKIQ